MSYIFTSGESDYMAIASNLGITTYPLTMACWFKPTNDTVAQRVLSLDDGTSNNMHVLALSGNVAGDPVSALSAGGGASSTAHTTTGYALGTWFHGCAMFPDATDAVRRYRRAFIDGGSQASQGTSRAATGFTQFQVGRAGGGSYAVGRFCEVAVWNIALADADVALLGAGANPLAIEPANLVAYWPLVNDLVDDVGALTLTNNGATQDSDHPTIDAPPGGMVNQIRNRIKNSGMGLDKIIMKKV